MIKVAINGFGRIGRMVLRAHYEGSKKHDLQFVAINDLGDAKTNAHLTAVRHRARALSVGRCEVDGDSMVVNGDRIKVVAERDPAKLPWKVARRRRRPGVHRAFSPARRRPARTCRRARRR